MWALYQQIKVREWETRQHANEVRETAWCCLTALTPGSQPFWRHGFASRFGRIAEQHDFSYIPKYDEIAQEIAAIFPEYADDDGTERLWEFLLSSYDRMPTSDDMLTRAIVEAKRIKSYGELDELICNHDDDFVF